MEQLFAKVIYSFWRSFIWKVNIGRKEVSRGDSVGKQDVGVAFLVTNKEKVIIVAIDEEKTVAVEKIIYLLSLPLVPQMI